MAGGTRPRPGRQPWGYRAARARRLRPWLCWAAPRPGRAGPREPRGAVAEAVAVACALGCAAAAASPGWMSRCRFSRKCHECRLRVHRAPVAALSALCPRAAARAALSRGHQRGLCPAEQPCTARSAEHSGNQGAVVCAAIDQHVPGGSKALVTHNFAFQLLWCLPVALVWGLGWHPVLPPCPSDWGCSCSTLVGMFRAVLVVAQA